MMKPDYIVGLRPWYKYYRFELLYNSGIVIRQYECDGLEQVIKNNNGDLLYIRLVPQIPTLPDFRVPIPINTKPIYFRRIKRTIPDGRIVDIKFCIGYETMDNKYLKCVSVLNGQIEDKVE